MSCLVTYRGGVGERLLIEVSDVLSPSKLQKRLTEDFSQGDYSFLSDGPFSIYEHLEDISNIIRFKRFTMKYQELRVFFDQFLEDDLHGAQASYERWIQTQQEP